MNFTFERNFTTAWGHALLQRVMPHASKSPRAIATKVAIDQLLFAPTCTVVFYFYKVLTEGRPG